MNKSITFTIGITFIFLFTIIIIPSCHHEPTIPASPEISYVNEIEPMILGSCAISGCHDIQRPLTNYTEIVRYVTPGKPSNSQLYNKITNLGPGQMPPDQPLSEEQIKLIYVWIMQGAKNN